jgi:hypothetical protein
LNRQKLLRGDITRSFYGGIQKHDLSVHRIETLSANRLNGTFSSVAT